MHKEVRAHGNGTETMSSYSRDIGACYCLLQQSSNLELLILCTEGPLFHMQHRLEAFCACITKQVGHLERSISLQALTLEVNIWTHLLGAVGYFLIPLALFGTLRTAYPLATTKDVLALMIFFSGVTICFSLSTLCVLYSLPPHPLTRT